MDFNPFNERECTEIREKEETEKEIDDGEWIWLVYWRVVFAISPFNCRLHIHTPCTHWEWVPISCAFRLIYICCVCQCPSHFWSLCTSNILSSILVPSSLLALHSMGLGNGCVFLMTPIYNVGDDFDNRRALDSKLHKLNNSNTIHSYFRPFQWFHGCFSMAYVHVDYLGSNFFPWALFDACFA